MPHVIGWFGRVGMTEIAIEEWMGASPIYTRRMQRTLGFTRDDVAAIFQGMQLDIGAPPEFMDFRYRVHGPSDGEFWLNHCGALMDVEPMGDEYVVAMCHHIEDPTFDATAVATNPRAQVRPIHRPPRTPGERHPHCHWTIRIDPSADAVVLPVEVTEPMGATFAARQPTATTHPGYPVLDPDLRMEDFSKEALGLILDEVALQGHLLTLSFAYAVARRSDSATARDLIVRQFRGVAGVVAGRLATAFGVTRDLDGIATVLALHPAFAPSPYVGLALEPGSGRLRMALEDCDAVSESDPGGWIAALAGGRADGAVASIAQAVCERAVVAPTEPLTTEVAAWEIHLGDTDTAEHADVTLTRFSTGATFEFRRTEVGHAVADATG